MNRLFLILGMGATEMFLIFVVVLLLFGGKKIPELMRGLGRGIREFNEAKENTVEKIKEEITESDNGKQVN